jgi:hypothetical protein
VISVWGVISDQKPVQVFGIVRPNLTIFHVAQDKWNFLSHNVALAIGGMCVALNMIETLQGGCFPSPAN